MISVGFRNGLVLFRPSTTTMTINNLSGESIFGASHRLSWQHLLGCLSWAERRLLMGWRRRKGRLGWYTRAVLLLHRVVCVVEKDVAPPDPCSGARLERVTYRIHNLNASVRVKNSVTSPALEGKQQQQAALESAPPRTSSALLWCGWGRRGKIMVRYVAVIWRPNFEQDFSMEVWVTKI